MFEEDMQLNFFGLVKVVKEIMPKMAERHPLKQVGEAKDIADIAGFLLSDNSTWMTGQIIGVDGGMSTLNIS